MISIMDERRRSRSLGESVIRLFHEDPFLMYEEDAMKYLKWTGFILLVVVLALIGWGFVEPRLLAVEEEDVSIAGLPEAWDGKRVAVVADWQIGMWADNGSTAADAVDRIVEEKPAIALLAGDFVYHPGQGEEARGELDEVYEIADKLVGAGIPTFAVLGNHDYAMDQRDSPANEELARRVRRTLRDAGVRVLTNEAVPLRTPAGSEVDPRQFPLYVVGVGSRWAGNADVDKALADVPAEAARVVVMHHPDTFARFPADTAPLAFAGHTHGGQIRLPLLPHFSYISWGKPDKVHADGWADDYGEAGNRLYVNRGIGMSVIPLRINCVPELTMVTLHRAAPRGEPMAGHP